MKVLKLILARGGSKGLPNKNIKKLIGKPLIQYSIEAAQKSNYGSEVFVSTDCPEIAKISKSCGANVPFLRPEKFSNDFSKSSDAIIHAIEYLEGKCKFYDYILLLEPTSPLRDFNDINNSIEFFISNKNAKSCVSVVKSELSHPSFLFEMNNELLKSYNDSNNVVRRQDLNDLYYPEGSIYLCSVSEYKKTKTFYNDNFTVGFEIPYWKSFEIDTIEDFFIIESLMKNEINKKLN